MELITLEGTKVVPNVHLVALPPFSKLWERDESTRKEEALNEFLYIEYMCSMKKTNPYKGYAEEDRPSAVGRAVFRNADYVPDEIVKECMNAYTEHLMNQLPMRLLAAAKSGAEKFIMDIQNIDVNERTKGGAAVFKPADLMKALAESDKVLAALQTLEKKVEEEVYTKMKTRGNRQINPFEE